MNNVAAGLGLLCGALAAAVIVIVLTAVAISAPVSVGPWVKLSLCSTADEGQDHEELLARLKYAGDVWAAKRHIIGLEAAAGLPECSRVYTALGATLYVKGQPDELVEVLQ